MKINWKSRVYRALWNLQDAIYIGVIVALVVYGWDDLVKASSWWFA